MNSDAKVVAELIESSRDIVALTGAGISTSAGIPDFRGKSGIYMTGKYDANRIFDIDSFFEDPAPFYEFARELVKLLDRAEPTFAHIFLKRLEDSGKQVSIITQNIDMLHRKAGSKNIIELHGSMEESFCVICNARYDFNEMKSKISKETVPRCDRCAGLLKPDVVFFGEPVHFFEKAIERVSESDLLIIVGSSLSVYPANSLVHYCKGKKVAVVKDARLYGFYDCLVNEDADEFFRKVEKELSVR